MSAVLAEKADIVILGKVIGNECVYQDGVIVTENEVTVQKIYSGNISVGDTVSVQQLGGAIGDESIPYLTDITVLEPNTTYV